MSNKLQLSDIRQLERNLNLQDIDLVVSTNRLFIIGCEIDVFVRRLTKRLKKSVVFTLYVCKPYENTLRGVIQFEKVVRKHHMTQSNNGLENYLYIQKDTSSRRGAEFLLYDYKVDSVSENYEDDDSNNKNRNRSNYVDATSPDLKKKTVLNLQKEREHLNIMRAYENDDEEVEQKQKQPGRLDFNAKQIINNNNNNTSQENVLVVIKNDGEDGNDDKNDKDSDTDKHKQKETSKRGVRDRNNNQNHYNSPKIVAISSDIFYNDISDDNIVINRKQKKTKSKQVNIKSKQINLVTDKNELQGSIQQNYKDLSQYNINIKMEEDQINMELCSLLGNNTQWQLQDLKNHIQNKYGNDINKHGRAMHVLYSQLDNFRKMIAANEKYFNSSQQTYLFDDIQNNNSSDNNLNFSCNSISTSTIPLFETSHNSTSEQINQDLLTPNSKDNKARAPFRITNANNSKHIQSQQLSNSNQKRQNSSKKLLYQP